MTFLHELNIAQLPFSDPHTYMVDLSSGPAACLMATNKFDRKKYPVRYYFTDFSRAEKFGSSSDSSQTLSNSTPFKKDVQECGMMFDRLLVNVRARSSIALSSGIVSILTDMSLSFIGTSYRSKIQVTGERHDLRRLRR